MDCGMWCVFSERRRHIERLWRRRLLVTSDERRARRSHSVDIWTQRMGLLRAFFPKNRPLFATSGVRKRPLTLTGLEGVELEKFLRLMRGFDAEDVEVIRKAVESNGIDSKACAPGPPMDEREDEAPPDEDSGLIPQIDRPMSMPYLCCKLWRWKDLQAWIVDAALHRLEALPWCRFGRVTINNATVSCCNPYHYALWIRPEINGNDDESGRNSETRDRRDQIVGNGHIGHITYRSHHNAATEIDLQTRLPRVLSSEIPDRPPPSIPSESPPPPDDSPPGTSTSTPLPPPLLHHAMSHAWGRLTRWERKDQIADSVQLTGPFAAVGILSQSVHDAQIVCSDWDLKNEVSFALIRQTEPLGSDNPEDIWLYNRFLSLQIDIHRFILVVQNLYSCV
ncbi:hypothetical protein WR25_01998 isoform C [Diploscapter pachys]|uniref:MH1 domain-containing protein n=1 Tax=Diploscapter pachys TaxID=2018661 RepID=A0A2A2L466_9BILA|nr:hypothetical protein WR25_01998 isoform C [Diploscapter pachys]